MMTRGMRAAFAVSGRRDGGDSKGDGDDVVHILLLICVLLLLFPSGLWRLPALARSYPVPSGLLQDRRTFSSVSPIRSLRLFHLLPYFAPMSDESIPAAGTAADGHFPSTRWTLVARLKTGDEKSMQRALEDLCSLYHYPLYCYIRRRGLDHHDAEDALHDFLAKVLRLDSFAAADADKGRLRGLLATSLQRFLLNWRRDQRHRQHEFSADQESSDSDSDDRYQKERFTDDETPERTFERQWAQETMRNAIRRLGVTYAAKGKQKLFKVLRPVLLGGGSLRGEDNAKLAEAAGVSEGALRVALTRMLSDFRDTLRTEVELTLAEGADVEEEIENLKLAVASN